MYLEYEYSEKAQRIIVPNDDYPMSTVIEAQYQQWFSKLALVMVTDELGVWQ